uniref:DBD_Tnp_Mut domain-containing protein n=1 Tax=Macrostomum lignano TaxID=282301 RepID=A0A1I8FAK0_9PLAT
RRGKMKSEEEENQRWEGNGGFRVSREEEDRREEERRQEEEEKQRKQSTDSGRSAGPYAFQEQQAIKEEKRPYATTKYVFVTDSTEDAGTHATQCLSFCAVNKEDFSSDVEVEDQQRGV